MIAATLSQFPNVKALHLCDCKYLIYDSETSRYPCGCNDHYEHFSDVVAASESSNYHLQDLSLRNCDLPQPNFTMSKLACFATTRRSQD